jgi:hypothetical protein
MAVFVTLEQAKTHLRVVDPASNGDVYLKAQQASAIIGDYLKSRLDATWDETTAPGPIQAATLLMLTHLYEHRGEDMASDQALWMAIDRLVVRYRDPALA